MMEMLFVFINSVRGNKNLANRENLHKKVRHGC